MVSMNRISNHSKNLLAALANYRENDDTVKNLPAEIICQLITDHRTIVPSYSLLIVWEVLFVKM